MTILPLLTPLKSESPRRCAHSLVGANTSSFQSLGTQLFVFVGDQVDAEREFIDVRTLSAQVEDTNL
jgi:hypothetical protein